MAIIIGLLVLLSGAAMTAGGVWLLTLGGSPYYVLARAALIASALFLFARHPLSRWIYAAVLLGTLVWAVIEVGFDWWQLAPRGGVLVILGLLERALDHAPFGGDFVRLLLLTALLSTAVAYVSYRWMERPLLNWVSRRDRVPG